MDRSKKQRPLRRLRGALVLSLLAGLIALAGCAARSSVLKVLVVEKGGGPVASARVHVEEGSVAKEMFKDDPVTDDQGLAVIDSLSTAVPVKLTVEADPKYKPCCDPFKFQDARRSEPYRLELEITPSAPVDSTQPDTIPPRKINYKN